jgi:hypothetical protein
MELSHARPPVPFGARPAPSDASLGRVIRASLLSDGRRINHTYAVNTLDRRHWIADNVVNMLVESHIVFGDSASLPTGSGFPNNTANGGRAA